MGVLLLVRIGVDELTDGGVVECEEGGYQVRGALGGSPAAGCRVDGHLRALQGGAV